MNQSGESLGRKRALDGHHAGAIFGMVGYLSCLSSELLVGLVILGLFTAPYILWLNSTRKGNSRWNLFARSIITCGIAAASSHFVENPTLLAR